MSQSDVTYVVFCRLEGIKEMPADQVAASVETLANIVQTVCQRDPSISSHSSVYGRLVVVPRRITAALDLAKNLHEVCSVAGVRLEIGIASGRVEATQDLTQQNVAGTVINRAARLAHLEGGVGRIAVDEWSFREATSASLRYPAAAFGALQRGKVKLSELVYCWLNYQAPQPAPPPTPRQGHEAETAHIVVYDIVRFSQKELRDLVQVVEDLNHAVRRALQSAGGNRLREGKDRWYAPAGDGGVLVFRADEGGGSRAAWAFAKALLDHSNERIHLRVGLTTGPIVVLEGNLPVGSGILEADRLSGMAAEGAACVSRNFWENVLERVDKVGWEASPVPGSDDALAISSTPLRSGFSKGSAHQDSISASPEVGPQSCEQESEPTDLRIERPGVGFIRRWWWVPLLLLLLLGGGGGFW